MQSRDLLLAGGLVRNLSNRVQRTSRSAPCKITKGKMVAQVGLHGPYAQRRAGQHRDREVLPESAEVFGGPAEDTNED